MTRWQRFKQWMGTDKARAIVNGACVPIWIWISASGEEAFIHWLGAINAAMFAFIAGGKLADHFNKRLLNMKDIIVEHQHRMILELLAERRDQLEDDQAVS